MQTASQVPHVPVPVPPPMAPAPVHADDSSNRLGTTSLVLGLIVALPILVLLVLNTYGARIQLQYKVNMAAYRTILNYIFGLIGLIAMFTGVVSLERMAKQTGNRPFFQAFAGIVLGMGAFYYLLAAITSSYGLMLAQLVYSH